MARAYPRRFQLVRQIDETGISGTGIVAHGVEFTDGTCAMRWKSAHKSTALYDNMKDLDAIHGHNGATVIEWID